MESCGHFQSLLLDHLYDLLDEREGHALRFHLEECPACQSALAKARSQQHLLAAAARLEFPQVQFTAPRPQLEPARVEPVVAAPASRWQAAWFPLAVALSLVLAVGVAAFFGGKAWKGYRAEQARALEAEKAHEDALAKARQLESEHDYKLASLASEAGAFEQDMQKLPGERDKELTRVAQDANARQLNVLVFGPEVMQPGRKNEYTIKTTDLNKVPLATTVDVKLVNQDKKVVYQPVVEATKATGEFRVSFLPDVPLYLNQHLTLEVVARRAEGPQVDVKGPVEVAGKPVYFTHLATDKPLYQLGEVVHFRSLTLDRGALKPPAEDLQVIFTINDSSEAHAEVYNSGPKTASLMDDKGKPVLGPDKNPIRGVGVGEFYLDPRFSGGEYVLTVKEMNNRFPAQVRKFRVSRYEPPRYNKELDFGQKSYGAGQEVTATASAEEVQGKAKLGNAPATVTIKIDDKWYDFDGKEYATEKKISKTTDKDGVLKLRFTLPEKIERGDANLSIAFKDEAITRAIPLVLKKLNVEFFPEGGDLVAGVANRVYFQVKSTLDKPADLRASIVYLDGDQEKVEIADVQTLHDDSKEARGFNLGMGAFSITPVAGRKYLLKVQEPIGIENKPQLPAVKDSGVVLNIAGGVFADKETIKVTVRSSTGNRSFWVGAYCRGRLVDQQAVAIKDGTEASVELKPAPGSGGVCRVTVFEEKTERNGLNLVPVAERLVYRVPSERLNIALTPDNPRSAPGEKVGVHLQASDENNELAGAIVMLAVVDKRVLTMADEKTARSMPTHFFLAPEVRGPEELEYADFLLGEHPKAKVALDLLLGTQGWRRFAEQDAEKFRKSNDGKQNADVERLLVLNGASAGNKSIFNLNDDERAAVEARYQSRMNEKHLLLVAKQNEQADEMEEAQDDQKEQARLATVARNDYRAAINELDEYEKTIATIRSVLLPGIVLALAVLGLVSLLIGVLRNVSRAVPYYAATALCFLFLLGLAGFFVWQGVGYHQLARLDSRKLQRDEDQQFQRDRATEAKGEDALNEAALKAPMADGAGLGGGRGGPFPGNAPPGAGKPGAHDVQGIAKGEGKDKFDGREAELKRAQAEMAKDAKGGADEARKKADRAVLAEQAGKQLEKMRGDMRMPRRPGGGFGSGSGSGGFGGGEFPVAPPNFQPRPDPFIVREYSHTAKKRPANAPREDFAETLYWHPALVVPRGESQTVNFDLSDSVTNFEVLAFGYTMDGRLGAATTLIESSLPFTVEPKLPLEVTATDKVDVAVKVSNNAPVNRVVTVKAEATGMKLDSSPRHEMEIAASSSSRKIFRFRPDMLEGDAVIDITGESKPFAADSVRRRLKVVPDGFPIVGSKSDMLEAQGQGGEANWQIVLPETWIKGTLNCQVEVYPSTLADLQKGLESLLREPNGCFEQTSTANYPNLLILDYMRESKQGDPQIEQRARDMLNRGYQKLTSFECQPPGAKKEGYEWFGGASPAHEALTAYGLLEFRDMARVMKIDDAMLQRTRAYLMEQKDGKGGFKRNARALDSFGRAPEEITNAYIVWSITESGQEDDVEKELTALNDKAQSSKDSYFVALVANSLLNRSKTKEGMILLTKLAEQQKEDGHLDAGSTSITCSGGRDLQIETTALSVLAWLKLPKFNEPVKKAVKWIGAQRGGFGGFGSTQSTILALKALIAFTKENKKTAEAGTLSLFVNEERVSSLEFAAGTQGTLGVSVPDPEKYLKPGTNKIRVEITGNNSFPHTLSWSYRTVKPASAEGCPLKLTTKLDRTRAEEGDTASLMVTIENTSKEVVNMPIAIIGLPGGMTLPEDLKQFDALRQPRDNGKTPGLISAYELRSNGRELVLYWRGLEAGQKVEVPLQVFCRVPGEYRGPASRAYLYYNADQKCWIDPVGIEIKAKE